MRTIKVYSTRGRQITEVKTAAKTWKELQKDLDEAQIEYSDMKAIIGENQNTLESPDALLPTGLKVKGVITNNFTLFLSPIRQKSGLEGYKELKQYIKEQCNNPKTAVVAKKHFGNYTQMTTDTMKALVRKWTSKGGKVPVTTKVTELLVNGTISAKSTTKVCKCKEVVEFDAVAEIDKAIAEIKLARAKSGKLVAVILDSAIRKLNAVKASMSATEVVVITNPEKFWERVQKNF